MASEEKIVFFDGVCGMCNASVDFVLSHDQKGVIRFTPLQGDRAKIELPNAFTEDLQTIVYKDDLGLHTRSEAILRIVKDMGGAWRLLYALVIIPRFMRDWLYREIALSRYRWFGKKDACRLPTPEERARFLD